MTQLYPTPNLIIYDTSAVVEYWNMNLGTNATVDQLKRRLDSAGGYTEIVPVPVIRECERLYRERILNDKGIPTYSAMGLQLMSEEGLVKDLPEYVTSHRERTISREFWSRNSRKGLRGLNVSRTDLDILSFARTMAQRGHNCHVLTYDSDIGSPCYYMQRDDGLNVFPVGYEYIDSLKDFLGGFKVVMLLENVVSDLFRIPEEKLGYLVVTRVDLVDQRVEVGVNIGDSLSGKKLREGNAARIPLTVFDIEDMPHIGERGYVLTNEDRKRKTDLVRGKSVPFVSRLVDSYRESRYIVVMRSRQLGDLEFVEMKISGRSMRNQRGVRGVEWTNLPHLLLEEHYMTGHYPKIFGVMEEVARQYK